MAGLTAHELARKLLEGPDVAVCHFDFGGDDVTHEAFSEVLLVSDKYFANEWKEGEHILLQ